MSDNRKGSSNMPPSTPSARPMLARPAAGVIACVNQGASNASPSLSCGSPARSGSDALRARLRSAGMALVQIDCDGRVTDQSRVGEDWLADLLCASGMFLHVLVESAAKWNEQSSPEAVAAMPGLWLIPTPMLTRRKRVGYSVAVLPGASLLGCDGGDEGGFESENTKPRDHEASTVVSETLAALCQSARPAMDVLVCRTLLAQLLGGPLAKDADVPRIAALVRYLHEDHVMLANSGEAIDSVGRQLAESYEEMNLLLTLTGNMTVQERPERFVALACEELFATLTYRWVGMAFEHSASARAKLKSLAGQMIVRSEPTSSSGSGAATGSASSTAWTSPVPAGKVRDAARRLLERATPEHAIVLDTTRESDSELAALGRIVVAHPVLSDGVVIGMLIAGDKIGPDAAASSIDAKLIGATASHVGIFLENAALYDDLNAMFLGTLEALTASIDAKDRYTCGHSQRVAHLTQQLARAIGLDEHTVNRCRIAGLVHDVGKIGVPETVLLKPGRLTEDEFAWIQRHPEMGFRILKDIPQLADVLPGVLHHHERWDGRGYPHRLQGEGIPLVARLIALADSFDAMSSTRTYRSAMSRDEVLREIERCSGAQFDPELAKAFVRLDFSAFDQLVREHRALEFGADADGTLKADAA